MEKKIDLKKLAAEVNELFANNLNESDEFSIDENARQEIDNILSSLAQNEEGQIDDMRQHFECFFSGDLTEEEIEEFYSSLDDVEFDFIDPNHKMPNLQPCRSNSLETEERIKDSSAPYKDMPKLKITGLD